jgi:hypothetical protein
LAASFPPPDDCRLETFRASQVPGEPRLSVCHVPATPAGLQALDQYSAAAWPLVCEQQRLPRKVFRRSIAWLSDSLFTLRRAGCHASTQNSLPAVGQTLLDGLFTRRAPTKGIRVLTSHPPFLSFTWRNHIDRSDQIKTRSALRSVCREKAC